jgi:DNA processing protein
MQTLPLTDAELAAWLRLANTPGLSRRAAHALLRVFGLPQCVLAASHAALAEVVGAAAATALLAPRASACEARQAALRAWLAHAGNQLVTLADPAYPRALLDVGDAPLLLHVSGRLELLHAPAVAIVGSRNASPQGLASAQAFAAALGAAGLTVVSGLAAGIDAAAHYGALHSAGGTVAVMGTGADLIYPARHRALAAQLAQRGALLSEWPLGTPARRAHFPQRNRLIAALARGVLVVEAAAQSGSLITARLANEIGRDVYAMPGSIHAALTKGCHRLIKEGAKLVETVADILEELSWPAAQAAHERHDTQAARQTSGAGAGAGAGPAPAPLARRPCHRAPRDAVRAASTSPDAQAVLRALGHDRAAPDVLARRSGLSPARVQSALLELELSGRIAPLPCGRVEPLSGPPQ